MSSGLPSTPAARIDYHGDVVAFDLDDTLMSERQWCRAAFHSIAEALHRRHGLHLPHLPLRMATHLRLRLPYFDLLEEILAQEREDMGCPEKRTLEMRHLVDDVYRQFSPTTFPMLEERSATLSRLHEQGIVMAIITDGRSFTQRAKIHALGVDAIIPPENIIISEESGADKSCPDNFQRLVRRYPEARRFLYIGDNPTKDFLMPNLLGWTTIESPRFCDSVHPRGEEADIMSAASVKLSNFSQILSDFNLSALKN